jgi:hypothetical protein
VGLLPRTRSVSFDVARLNGFRAKGPTICIAQATGLGGTKTRYELGLKARQFAKRSGLQPSDEYVSPSPSPSGWAMQTSKALPLQMRNFKTYASGLDRSDEALVG